MNNETKLTEAEKERSIERILDAAPLRPLTLRAQLHATTQALPLRLLFFGIGDCLVLASALAALAFASIIAAVGNAAAKDAVMLPLLFLFAPAPYALLLILTTAKESGCGMAEQMRAYRISFPAITALRALAFGGSATVICVMANLLVWEAAAHVIPLTHALAISFASLFLYAALSLFCARIRRMALTLGVPPATWIVFGALLLTSPSASTFVESIPPFVALAAAALGCAAWLFETRRFLSCIYPLYSQEVCHAVR